MLSSKEQIDILFEEYRVLYGLVNFRMTSLDRRAPIAGAAFATFLASLAVMPPETRFIFLWGLPIALIWFLRTTINHARSFEDVLRRLDEIEYHVNRLAHVELLAFQRQHPSKGRAVGGRTGTESVHSVFVTCVLMLAACTYFYHVYSAAGMQLYYAYPLLVLLYLICCMLRLSRYSYAPRPDLAARRDPDT